MALKTYLKKRKFEKTPEPRGGKKSESPTKIFVVQKHSARALHYDFRIEHKGVLLSWAVPKGFSMDPKVKHYAKKVEDHPTDYAEFEGIIPKGNYGAGEVIVWDRGVYTAGEDPYTSEKYLDQGLSKPSQHFTVTLLGNKLKGSFVLSQIKNDDWIIFKRNDEYASKNKVFDERSVVSGKTVEELKNETNLKAELLFGEKTPMPDYFRPMMAKVADSPFDKNGWIYEIKWDGYRVLAFVKKNKVELISRNLKKFNIRFPELTLELKKIKTDAIIDGEVVALNPDGKPNFQALQDNLLNKKINLRYFVFDLIYYDGYELSNIPLIKRKIILSQILPKSHVIKFCDHVEDKGIRFFSGIKKIGLEGAMAKDGQGRYLKNTRSSLWLKIKNFKSREAIIIGYTNPKGDRGYFGSLVLAAYKSDQLYYIGHVGSGFNDKMLESLFKKFQKLVILEPPIRQFPKTNNLITWLKPQLVCEIKFNEMTKENILRQPSYIRLRDDINPIEVGL